MKGFSKEAVSNNFCQILGFFLFSGHWKYAMFNDLTLIIEFISKLLDSCAQAPSSYRQSNHQNVCTVQFLIFFHFLDKSGWALHIYPEKKFPNCLYLPNSLRTSKSWPDKTKLRVQKSKGVKSVSKKCQEDWACLLKMIN